MKGSLPFYRLKKLKLAAWMSMITFTARMDLSQHLNPALLASSPVSTFSSSRLLFTEQEFLSQSFSKLWKQGFQGQGPQAPDF